VEIEKMLNRLSELGSFLDLEEIFFLADADVDLKFDGFLGVVGPLGILDHGQRLIYNWE
jgi:hypothetical protein